MQETWSANTTRYVKIYTGSGWLDTQTQQNNTIHKVAVEHLLEKL